MKKISLLLATLLLFSMFSISVLAQKENVSIEHSPSNICSHWYCKNVVELLKKINDVLRGDILDTLDEIAEKNTTVIVELPEVNVTIPQPLDVNVLSQPTGDCEWETYSQVIDVGIQGGYETVYIPVPEGAFAEEINVTRAFVYFKWSASGGDKCTLLINDIICLRKSGNSGQNYYLNSLEADCLYAFTPGLNKVTTSYIGGCFSEHLGVGELMVEMQVKPANC